MNEHEIEQMLITTSTIQDQVARSLIFRLIDEVRRLQQLVPNKDHPTHIFVMQGRWKRCMKCAAISGSETAQGICQFT